MHTASLTISKTMEKFVSNATSPLPMMALLLWERCVKKGGMCEKLELIYIFILLLFFCFILALSQRTFRVQWVRQATRKRNMGFREQALLQEVLRGLTKGGAQEAGKEEERRGTSTKR
jgi:hypothetical protein